MYHKDMRNDHRAGERGNLFFYIFMAVALFAGLTFAVSQGGRVSVQSLTREQARLQATEIIDYSDAMAKAVGTLRLRGTTLARLRFAHADLSTADYGNPATTDPLDMVFNPQGGGIIYRPPSPDMLATAGEHYAFLNKNEVEGFGQTCGTTGCSDLLMALRDIKTETCLVINNLGDITNPSDLPPEDADFDFTGKFQGSMDGPPETLGDEASSAGLAGKAYGCFTNNTDGKNYFYRVLWAQ